MTSSGIAKTDSFGKGANVHDNNNDRNQIRLTQFSHGAG